MELVAGIGDVLQPWGTYCKHGGLGVVGMGGLLLEWGLVGGGGRAGHTNTDGWGCGIVHQLKVFMHRISPPLGLYSDLVA